MLTMILQKSPNKVTLVILNTFVKPGSGLPSTQIESNITTPMADPLS